MSVPVRVRVLLVGGALLFGAVLAMRVSGEHLRRKGADELWVRDGEQARDSYVLASRLDPMDYRSLVGEADTYLEAGHQPWLGTPDQVETLERAVALYRQAVRRQPADPNTWAQMARAYRALAVARRASRPIDLSSLGDPQAMHQPEDDLAQAAMTRALELEPSNYIYVDYLADLSYARDEEDALEWYRRGARVLPNLKAHAFLEDPASVPADVAEAVVLGARDALGTKNVVVDSQILEEISWFHSRRGSYQEAADSCLEAIEAGHPYAAELWTRRGLWLDHLGQVDQATQAFLRSLELKPGRALSHFGLGQIAAREGDVQGALSRFRAARDHAPKNLRFQLTLAKALVDAQDFEEATRVYQVATRIPGGEVPAATALVDLFRRRGIYDQALVYAKRLMELHPGEEAFVRQVGELEARLTF
jgi:tetratricopeptide (TPR) repeat protein